MPGFTENWTLTPALQAHTDDLDRRVQTYTVTPGNGVGDAVADTDADRLISCFDIANDLLWVDAGTWAIRDNTHLVLARKASGPLVWLDRSAVRDPAYATTTTAIQTTAAEQDAALREGYWKDKRAAIEESKTVTLPDAFDGVLPDDKITQIPAGRYERVAIRDDGVFGLPNSAPFYLVIKLGTKRYAAISPAALEGVGSPTEDAPVDARPVPAMTLRSAFAGTSEHIRRHIPDGTWLSDEQIHYLTPDEMGAAYVLERVPNSNDVRDVKSNRDQHNTFTTGSSLPGLRLGADILVLNSMRGTGTEYHEAVHQRSHGNFRAALGWDFNEGATEYFTRVVVGCAAAVDRPLRNDSPYEPQHLTARAFVDLDIVNEVALADAYFGGRLAPLYAGFDRATNGELSLQAFVENQRTATASVARDLLERKCEAVRGH